MARRRRSLLGSKKSKTKGPVPKFGAVSPPSNEPEVEPVATSEANKAPDLSTGQEAEAQSDLDEFDVETESVSKPESVEAFNLVTASAVAAEDSPLAEADEPVEAVPEADSFFGAEGADFISDDLPVDEDEVAAEDDDQPDTFGDIELEPAAPEAEFFASDVLSAPNDADAQIFDVSDLPEMGLPEGDAYAIGEEIDTLDELFQFEDFPTDVPEDLVEITDEGEALDSEDSFFGTSLDSDLVDASFASSKSGFIDDDFSDLRRDVTDVPIDSNFVAAVLRKSAAQGQSENEAESEGGGELVPQTLEANIPLDDDGNAAFSGMQSIPEEEETGRFVRDMTFDFDAGSGGSAPDPAVEGEEKLPNFGFGQDGPLGFGEGVPPTEEIPTAVLEDLASPHYASMSLPESPEIEGFGSFGHDASDFDDLEEAPQRTDYTVVVIVGSALVIGVILSWFMLN